MELKTLTSFVAVATHQSFSAAAKSLNTVQPAISRHITLLEQELNTKLFFRTSREVSLTAAGELLLKDAQQIINQAKATKQAVMRAASGQVGRLTIGYLGGATLSFLPRLVRAYIGHQPHIDVNLIEMTASEQIEALVEKRIDISFSRPLPAQYAEQFVSQELYVDQLVAVMSYEHPLAQHNTIQLAQLTQDAFVLFDRNSAVGLFDTIIKECRNSGFSPTIVNSPTQMQTVLTHVSSGIGVSIVPSSIRDLRSDECVFIPLHNVSAPMPLVMSYPQHTISPTAKDFIALVANDIESIQKQMAL